MHDKEGQFTAELLIVEEDRTRSDSLGHDGKGKDQSAPEAQAGGSG